MGREVYAAGLPVLLFLILSGVATIIIPIILLLLCVICGEIPLAVLALLLSKGRHGILNVCNNLSAVHIKVRQALTSVDSGELKKTVLHPVASRNRTFAPELQSSTLANQPQAPVVNDFNCKFYSSTSYYTRDFS